MNVDLFHWRLEKKLFLRMELFIMDSGKEIINTATVFKSGQMVPDMRACGKTVKLVVKASFGMLMATYLKESGRMIKQMAMEYISIQMEQVIRATGKMIYNMAKAKNFGLMEVNTSETIIWVRRMAKENIGGLTAVIIMDNGLKTK